MWNYETKMYEIKVEIMKYIFFIIGLKSQLWD